MKIAYVAAGAGGMYCGSCLHDNTLAAALIQAGVDVLLVPLYTPIRTDEEDMSCDRMFFGGINVALQQRLALFRHTPRWIDRLFDQPRLLSWLASRASTTHPRALGSMTVSMLSGERGRQKKEFEKLVAWLADDVRPDLVHLSNTLLSALAGRIKLRLDIPVVSTLSGEDIFIEKLADPYYSQTRELLKEHGQQIDAFVSLNRYYADFMSEYLAVERSRVHVIPHGLNLEGHGTRAGGGRSDVRTIGYFARICHDKGLHLLAEAFALLAAEGNLGQLQLRVAGSMGRSDQGYLDGIRQQLGEQGLSDRFEYVGQLSRVEKIAFLQSIDVMCVPTVYRESKGLSVLEAMANAVPVVLPAHGSFPELVEDTGGGILCQPNDPQAIAAALRTVLSDPAAAEQLGRQGQSAVRQRYHAAGMAERTRELYARLTAKKSS